MRQEMTPFWIPCGGSGSYGCGDGGHRLSELGGGGLLVFWLGVAILPVGYSTAFSEL